MSQYTEIISAAIMLFVAIIGTLITKNHINGSKFSEFLKWVQIFVDAAEQLYPDGQGEQKKSYVKSKLADRGYAITPETDAAIEAAVYEVNKNESA